VPVLSSWWQRRQETAAVDSWRYRESWVPVPTETAASGTWLVVAPVRWAADEWLATVVAELDAPVVVEVDVLDVGRDRLAAQIGDMSVRAGSLTGIVSLPPTGDTSVGAAPAATARLLAAGAEAGIEVPLWTVTRGAVSVGQGDPVTRPWQSGLWGLGRV